MRTFREGCPGAEGNKDLELRRDIGAGEKPRSPLQRVGKQKDELDLPG